MHWGKSKPRSLRTTSRWKDSIFIREGVEFERRDETETSFEMRKGVRVDLRR
jgi:hypothetical protein